MQRLPPPASPRRGLGLALQLWRVVAAVWLVPAVFLLPAGLVAWASLARGLGQMPEVGVVPDGDLLLVAAQSLHNTGAAFLVVSAFGLALVAAWVPLWHGGVVRWRTWAAGRSPRLGEVLGLGIGSWWRYLRLGFAGAGGLLGLLLAVWLPLGAAADAAREQLAEVREVNLQLVALGLSVAAVVLVVAATSRAAWLLGEPGRRSATVAWLRGLACTLRRPLSSVGTAILWLLAGAVFAKGPVLLLLLVPALRPGGISLLLAALGGLGAAVCWVALLGSFGPPPPEPAEEAEPAAAGGPEPAAPATEPTEEPEVESPERDAGPGAEPEPPSAEPQADKPEGYGGEL